MRAFTDIDLLFGASDRPADDAVSSVLEPADGTVSLDGAKYEDILAIVSVFNNVAGAKSASVQFYEADAQSGDISSTWTAVGSAVAVDLTSSVAGYTGVASINRQSLTKKYVSAIATCTIIDPGPGVTTTCQLVLAGVPVDRVES